MYLNDSWLCCGLREAGGLSHSRTPTEALKEFWEETRTIKHEWSSGPVRRNKFRYVIFSGTSRGKYAEKLKAHIEANKLGEVISTGYHKNPNSGNQLQVYVWTVDWEAFKKYGELQRWEPYYEEEKPNGKGSTSPETPTAQG